MSPLTILRAARAKVESGWTRWASARDALGVSVGPGDPSAVCGCSSGAIVLASGDEGDDGAYRALSAQSKRLFGRGVVSLNDYPGTTIDMVLTAFDAAIEEEEKCE